jgi:hypothetical protein
MPTLPVTHDQATNCEPGARATEPSGSPTIGANEYSNSRRFELCMTSRTSEVERCAEHLLRLVYRRLPRRRFDEAKIHLKAIMMDLLVSFAVDATRWLAHSRSVAHYRELPRRYNAINIKGRRLLSLIDRLKQLGLIEYRTGFRAAGDFEQGRWSRMRATPTLIDLLDRFGISRDMAERAACEELIILRAPKKGDKRRGALIDYTDTSPTRAMRNRARLINTRISQGWIDLCVPDARIPVLNEELARRELRKREGIMPYDPLHTTLRRILNNESFENGGRFYGGFWQQLPKAWRRFITINGFPTIEIDYSAMHIRMMYAKAGLPLPNDPYTLPDLDANKRDFLKAVVNTIVNASNRTSAVMSAMADAPDWKLPSDRKSMELLIRRFEELHAPIRQFFYRGYGVRLQYQDSMIAERVLLELGNNGCVVLPVHDSFIAKTEDAGPLEAAMATAFEESCGYRAIMKSAAVEHDEAHDEFLAAVASLRTHEGSDASTGDLAKRYASYVNRRDAWLRRIDDAKRRDVARRSTRRRRTATTRRHERQPQATSDVDGTGAGP